MLRLTITLWTALNLLLAATGWAQQAWRPGKNVEISVPAAPGAAFDTTGRTIKRILIELELVKYPAK